VAEAVAYMQPIDRDAYPELTGYILFKQSTSPGGQVTSVSVDVSNLRGVPAGMRGFHVHQYGDTESTRLVGGHFKPTCIDDPDVNSTQRKSPTSRAAPTCEQDRKHGLPPSVERNPGDMGNLLCVNTTTPTSCLVCFANETSASTGCTPTKTLGQEKMSLLGADAAEDAAALQNRVRSVVGRSVALHMFEDVGYLDPEPPTPGNSGPTFAFGVIGVTRPGAATPGSPATSNVNDENVAAVITHPVKPNAMVCHFPTSISQSVNVGVSGKAIVEVHRGLVSTDDHKRCELRVDITGLSAGTYQVGFREWGDLRYANNIDDATLIGASVVANDLVTQTLTVSDASTTASLYTNCSLNVTTLANLFGRSMTIVNGTTTVAMATCGLANPYEPSCFTDALNQCENLDGSPRLGGGGGSSYTPPSTGGGSNNGDDGLTDESITVIVLAVFLCCVAAVAFYRWRREEKVMQLPETRNSMTV